MEHHSDEGSIIRKAQLFIRPNSPVELGTDEETQFSGSNEDRRMLRQISETLVAYRNSMKNLLAGSYSSLREVTPVHMTDACCLMAFVFTDGILLRYDLKRTTDQKGFVGVVEGGSLESMAPQLSGSLVQSIGSPRV